MSSVKPHLHAQKPTLPIARHRSNTAGSSSSSTASTTSVDLDPGASSTKEEPNSDFQDPPIDTGTIRCICGISDDDGFTIQCDKCLVWQHAFCVNIDKHNIPDQYLCDMCDPVPRYYNVKRAVEHQARRSQAERKAEQEERRGGKRTGSPSSSHRKKHSASADDIGLKRRKRSDGGDKSHPKRSASFGLKRKASDDTTEMWESALKQALSSAFNKSDNDSSGPDKKQKTGYVTITKYENSRESSPLTPRTVEHTSRYDADDFAFKPAGKQSPAYKPDQVKLEDSAAAADSEKPSAIAILTRKLSADSTESINVTSPSPTRETPPPPPFTFSSAGQDNSANESGDENVDIDGDVQMAAEPSPQPKSLKRRKKAKRTTGGSYAADQDAASGSSLSSAASDNDDASDDSATKPPRIKRVNGQADLPKATLDKYRIRSSASDEDDSSVNHNTMRKPKSLPLNLPCKKLWMRNYLQESENAIASKKARQQAQKEPTSVTSPIPMTQPVTKPTVEVTAVEEGPAPETPALDTSVQEEPADDTEMFHVPESEKAEPEEAEPEEAEAMVDIVGDEKEVVELPAVDLPEPTPIDEHDIFSDNESTASTVPADDLDHSFLSSEHALEAEETTLHADDTAVKDVVEENLEKSMTSWPPSEAEPALESVESNDNTIDETKEDVAAPPVPTATTDMDPSTTATDATADHEAQAQTAATAPKVVRLSVKEYLSKRAAAAQRDDSDKPTSDETPSLATTEASAGDVPKANVTADVIDSSPS